MADARDSGTAAQPLHLHSRVKVSNLGHGEVLFVGQTSFAPGVWVGIELDNQNGKNNGSVQGKRYFECEDGYGVFVRSSQVHVLSPEEEMHSVDDEPMPPPTPAAARASRPAATSTPSATAASAAARLSPRKGVAVTPARTPAPRTSLAPSAPPSAVRRSSAVSTGSSVSSASASRPPTSASIASRTSSPIKPATGVRSPVKPSITGRVSVASSATRSAAASTLASRNASPSTPVATMRTTRTGATTTSGATPSTRTAAAGTGVTRTATRATPSATAAAKAQTPAAARAGLRPVPTSRPSMVAGASRTTTSSPSVASASRVGTARTVAASAPISRAASSAASSAGAASRTGSSLGPSRLGPRSSAGSAVSSGRTSASQRLLDPEDGGDYDLEDEDDDDQDLISTASGTARRGLADADDVIDEADLTISNDTIADSTLRSTKGLNKSTRDFMSLVEPSASNAALRSSAEFGALQKEVEELRAKVRVLEKKRDDERGRIAELEKTKEEAETAIAAAPKLTAKVQELQAELKDQKKLEKDWAMQKDDFERQLSRLNDELESLTLDREMAEEKAETAVLESEEHLMSLEAAKAKIRALEKDMNPHRLRQSATDGERGEDTDGEGEGAAYSAASDLLQRENDQLRRVLRDLRDRSNEIEGDHRRKIIELERENAELIELNSTNESLLPELENAESMIEDLKLQLDDALGAQDLVEQLTERNLQLSDLVKKFRDEIEELETIAEINNELEEQHTINEKELREEIDLCESRIRDLQVRNEGLENNAVDYQNTFGQFRDLVSNLQSELEAAKAEQAEYGGGAGAERKDRADQAMLNLNLKLQSSALKSQAKTIDLELGRLQASQATSHLEMVRSYLPTAYFEADADAVNCLLFFRRMAAKSDLIKSIVETNHDIQESLSGIVPEIMVSVCQMRHSIAHFSALSRQIAAVLRLAPTEVFLRGGRMYRENMAIERKVDAFIAALRCEELKEQECGLEFGRFVKQFEDFTMALGGDENDSDLAAKEVGSANLIDHDLDTLIAALGYAKQQLAQLYADDDVEWDMAGKNIEDDLFDPLQELINRIRNTKVLTRKVLRRLLSLAENDEAVRMEAIMNLPPLGRLTSQLVTFATQLSKSISTYVAEVRSSKAIFEISRVTEIVSEATEEGLGKSDISLWSGPLSSTSHLSTTIQTVLTAIVEQENVIRIDGPGPWLARAEDIKTQAAQNPELERQVAKLSEDARDLLRQVKARDQALQEGSIKIERLQKQLEKSKAQVDEHSDVRSTLTETQRQAKAYQDANDALQSEIEALQKDHDRLKAQIAAAPADGLAAAQVAGDDAKLGSSARTLQEGVDLNASYSSLETSYLVDQLEALKGALRHLRHENAVLKGSVLLQQVEALPALVRRSQRTVASAAADGDEGDTKKVGEPVKSVPPRKAGSVGSVRSEAKQLYNTALTTLALSSVVDLTPLNRRPEGDGKGAGRPWLPYHKQPEVQLERQAQTRVKLMRQLTACSERLAQGGRRGGATSFMRAVQA